MSEAVEQLTHPILGTLVWEPEFTCWSTQLTLPTGTHIDVVVKPFGGDGYAFLQQAAELLQWAMANERRVLADAMAAELVELYNGVWRQDDRILTVAELTEQHEWQLLVISASRTVPVEFSYDAGELFGGHTVTVEVDAALNFRDIDLCG